MRVFILGINYAPEPIGIGPYTAGVAEALAAAGHDVRVITGKPSYPAWRKADGYGRSAWHHERINGVNVTRCALYVPRRPTGLRRILHQASFVAMATVPTLFFAIRSRPELVLCIAPSLMTAPLAKLTARLAGARCWLHVQDFEVEAAFATSLLTRDSRIGGLALRFQRWAFTGWDLLTSISKPMCTKLTEVAGRRGRIDEMRNWAETERVRPFADQSLYRREWNITAPVVALYSGNIANKQGLGLVVEAAHLLRHRPDVAFVICGDGPQKAALEVSAAGLTNVHFRPLQPAERLGDLLGLASVHLLPQLGGAADLVLPSKLTNMLASGRPIIATAMPGTALAAEVEECGIATPPDDAKSFAAAIISLADDPVMARKLGRAARIRAEQYWSRKAVLRHAVLLAEELGAGTVLNYSN